MRKKVLSKTLALIIILSLVLAQGANAYAISGKNAAAPNADIKNIIVMIPDGMSIDGVTLARWYKAYDAETGALDTTAALALDELASGLVRTYWSNGETIGAVTDSAPAGTAYASGIKTNDKYVGVTPESVPVATILEAAKLIGKSTGMVATSNIQHATPATFSSHYNDRSKYDIIGEQQAYNGVDVLMGGGSMYLTEPYRQDAENIVSELKAMEYRYVTTRDEMNAVQDGKLWGMFAGDAMAYEMDRSENAGTEPSLAEMTVKAIELLSKNAEGFFLMVVGSKVDWAAHATDPIGLISDILAFDEAVKVALDYAKKNQDTMLLIMSDHGNGGITIGNTETDGSYSKDPVSKFIAPLKKAILTGEGVAAKFDAERANVAEMMKNWYGIDDLTDEEIETIKETDAASMNYAVGPMISKRAFLGWTTGGHTGEEVMLFTYLPQDGRVTGTLDNTDIARICAGVWEIDLAETTGKLYNDAESRFKSKGATVRTDTAVQSGGKMTVTKGGTTLTILENKNYVTLNGNKRQIDGVVVNQGGKFYVPQSVLDMLP
jgi:alkaline phosphatase